MVTQSQQVVQVPTHKWSAQSQQVAEVVTQLPQTPTQMVSQNQVAEANINRCLTPTLMKLLETTNDEFDFINSPS